MTADVRKVIPNTDGTWKYADDAVTGVTLKIKAGIVYKIGGPEPVARVTFYLLDSFPLEDLDKLPPVGTENAIRELLAGSSPDR